MQYPSDGRAEFIPNAPSCLLWRTPLALFTSDWRPWTWGVMVASPHMEALAVFDTPEEAVAAAQEDTRQGSPRARALVDAWWSANRVNYGR